MNDRISLRLMNAMARDWDMIHNAQDTINAAIKSGQYVAIELENGEVVRLDKPIKIFNLDVHDNVNGRWNFNE